jgi:hypothetical protein
VPEIERNFYEVKVYIFQCISRKASESSKSGKYGIKMGFIQVLFYTAIFFWT